MSNPLLSVWIRNSPSAVPPIDPPTTGSDDDGDPLVAAGFSLDAATEPYDQDHHDDLIDAGDEVVARVREALEADARTSGLADSLEVQHAGRRVVVRASSTPSWTRTRWWTSWSRSWMWTRSSAA